MENLSVIIPVYNNENILDNIQNKILYLSNHFIQIIIVDDCSLDNTFLELNNFIKRNNLTNIEIYKNNQNMGPSYSRNIGLKKASSDYIAFLDSDDDWHPQKIKIQIEMMKKFNFKISGTKHKIIESKELYKEQLIDYQKLENIPFSIVKWPKILFVSPFATPSVIIHKSLKEYLFDETIRYSEDYNLWKRITYKNKAIKIELPLTFTFKHDYISESNSLSSNLKEMQLGVEKSFKNLIISNEIFLLDKLFLVFGLYFSKFKYIRRLFIRKIRK
ncbi:glycosyltransferase family 2 protein [Aliarcobacter butzleri]|uniref:glycosyltransferase family 2 protein n=1 Tax=Aliarcobacter butzleri TaxID=28197 RepID=UPI001EDB37CF|nr:glycosyltransferase family 2 protein [Aliarcobacter butzleri]MCG3658919.1 glycosyltransferase [Aliarcobacter butzleri]